MVAVGPTFLPPVIKNILCVLDSVPAGFLGRGVQGPMLPPAQKGPLFCSLAQTLEAPVAWFL